MKLFYGIAGEGLGHAIRCMSILERLEEEVHVFTWGDALEFFHKEGYPYLHEIAGVPWGRNKNNQITIHHNLINLAKFGWNYASSLKYVSDLAKKLKPNLFVTDFEPIIPRVADKLSMHCISIDNQHKFSRCRTADLPLKLRLYANLMGVFTEYFVPNVEHSLVSTFYHNAINVEKEHTSLTNCFFRKAFEQYKPENGDYLLVYYKKSCGEKLLDILSRFDYPVKVFNAPARKYKFEYYDLKNEEFIIALAGCKALFAGAGNQLLGEALYYNKPMFVIPEPNQPEQEINGRYVQYMDWGESCSLNDLNEDRIESFLNKSYYSERCSNGVYEAIECIRKYL